ncbi:MAG: metalloregulator ArsR/SmtB family transcription factor [Candidatus Omnitrophota bacterium]
MAKYKNVLQRLVAVCKALGDEHRLRALLALRDGELCVCQIVELLALAPSTVSKHMSILKHAGWVDSVKRGRWVHYRLSSGLSSPEFRQILQSALAVLEKDMALPKLNKDEQLCCDRKKLKQILKMKPEDLCKKNPC